MKKKVSLTDVAKSCGVSPALVSLVINKKGDSHGISAETQKLVLEKVKELDYQPNALARGFRTGKTNTIGLIVSDISNSFYSGIARKIEDLAWNSGYSLITCSSDENIDKEIRQVALFRERRVDGIIVSSSQEGPDFFNNLLLEKFPHVLIDRTFDGLESPSVTVDNYGGGRLAARHLVNQGMKKIGIISITPGHISTVNQRISGFQSVLAETGIFIPEKWNVRAPFGTIEKTIKENLQRWFYENDLPEAIFSLNNNLTAACLESMRKLSIKIPQEVAIIGFDNPLYFGFSNPSISAIDQPVEQIGQTAFDMLFGQIIEKDFTPANKNIVLPVDLIIRESSIKPN
jgi:LacI family transcriptional regulator